MMISANKYLSALSKELASGIAKEHAYRPALKALIEGIAEGVHAVNDPARQACGAPDFVVSHVRRNQRTDVGYIEAKDVTVGLAGLEKGEQLQRYLTSLDNLILTNYVAFRFFRHGKEVASVTIGEMRKGKLVPVPSGYEELERHLREFVTYRGQTISSAVTLAGLMARKAQLMRDVFYKALMDRDTPSTLRDQLAAFRQVLIHDMDEHQFADVYAQTITYGLFTARLHDATLSDFTRQEARDLIPRSNPFLRRLFDYVCGVDLDDRVAWIVDALCEVYRLANVRAIVKEFGSSAGKNDPIIHFYETFLGEYDPELRVSRGVWYTPQPVVNFIVRAIDDALTSEFELPDGLADVTKVQIDVDDQLIDNRTRSGKAKKRIEVHKVQLLDVATGTGTFTAEAIKRIYTRFEGQRGSWSQYVEKHLLPRLHGFEILMASYAMCHLKIDMLLNELGYKPARPDDPPRLSVYLTNTLEEHHPDADTLFASWLAKEANAASRIKRDMPIMVAYGNPPYNSSSQNRGPWIRELIAAYKEGLNEKKINLDDDYIKFVRYAENAIAKTGHGIAALITNNSFLDGVTHRQMRRHLLSTFDKIFVVNLHGDQNKGEITPDGKLDQNVFDITQGVAITIMLKTGARRGKLATVQRADFWGTRQEKYDRLSDSDLASIKFEEANPTAPYFFFHRTSVAVSNRYQEFFPLREAFPVWNSGLTTDRDSLFIDFEREALSARIKTLLSGKFSEEFREAYGVRDTSSYKMSTKLRGARFDEKHIGRMLYRPFDTRWIYYDPTIISRAADDVMRHVFNHDNVGLSMPRISNEDAGAFVSTVIVGHKTYSSYNRNSLFPLYVYPTDGGGTLISDATVKRRPNLSQPFVEAFSKNIGRSFAPDRSTSGKSSGALFAPIDVLDYIYAVLHSARYREVYRESLRVDFPHVPLPADEKSFWTMVAFGQRLRKLHMLEPSALPKPGTRFTEDGDCVVTEARFSKGRVYINKTQYFDAVPEAAWEGMIGGYQPAQRWLKDRVGRALEFEDIRTWQRIVAAIVETYRTTAEIDDAWRAPGT